MSISDKEAKELDVVATIVSLFGAVLLIALGLGAFWLWHISSYSSTDDSYWHHDRHGAIFIIAGCGLITFGIRWAKRAITNNFTDDEV